MKIGNNNTFQAGSKQIPDASHQGGVGQNQPPNQISNQQPGKQNINPNQSTTHQNGFNKGGSTNTNTSNKYAPMLITYLVIFFVLFIAAYFILKYKDVKINARNGTLLIISLLCVGLFLRISAATLIEGQSGDLNLFKTWATNVSSNFSNFYSTGRSCDYPPFYIYILYIVGKVVSISSMSNYFTLIIKLPSILADIASAFIIYKLARKYLTLENSILASAFYIFNPAIFINSTLWGQVDSLFTLIVILAIFLLSEKKLGWSVVLFAMSVLMKPQGIIFLPVLFFELIRIKKAKNFVKAIVIALGVAVVVIVPFSRDPMWIYRLYSSTVGEYPYASVNAYNFFALIKGNYVKDTSNLFLLSYHSWGMIFIVLITAFSWLIYIKGKSNKYAFVAALIQIAGVFTFSVGMHERYLFPAVALAILSFIYLNDKRILILTLGYSLTSYINTHTILFDSLKGANSGDYNATIIFTSLLNVLLFAYLVKIAFDIAIRKKIYSV